MQQKPNQPVLKVLKVGNCSTLSDRGVLGYQVGCNQESEIFLRITSNSGGGWFSSEWVSLNVILSALTKANKPLTSYALFPLFAGKSVNTPAFLFATLKQEGLVAIDTENPRCYLALSSDAFVSSIKELIATGSDLKVEPEAAEKRHAKSSSKDIYEIPVMLSPTKIKANKS